MTSMHHDCGGDDLGPIDLKDRDKSFAFWERQVHALLRLIVNKGLLTVHEFRKAIEALLPESYDGLTYYEKWTASIITLLSERKIISVDDIEKELGILQDDPEVRFKKGDIVRVRQENLATRWRRPHLRTPGYIFGAIGEIVDYKGTFHNPERVAFQQSGPKQPLYIVRFPQKQLWHLYDGNPNDTVDCDIYQHWLEPSTREALQAHSQSHLHQHSHEHSHGTVDHGDHTHDARTQTEQKAIDAEGDDSERRKLSEALVRVLVAKGIVTPDELRKGIEEIDKLDKSEGAKIVAKAWVDPVYKEKLLSDASTLLPGAELIAGDNPNATKLVAVENTPTVHHLIVCTLCSCYPTSLLGLAPPWYKSRSYRAKAVKDPRGTLREFGLEIPPNVAIQVHDSTADLRYLVIPERPKGTEGWTEEQLQTLVNRDSMVGVSRATEPSQKV